MQRLQPLTGDVRINLRCRNIRMTEKQLDDTQIGSVIEQVRSKRMAQDMR